jgi:hypothetical protein
VQGLCATAAWPGMFLGGSFDIRIVVTNGTIILLGSVASKADYDIAYLQCSSVPSALRSLIWLRINALEYKQKQS